MRTERIISNLPELRDTLSVRSRIALNGGVPARAAEAASLTPSGERTFDLRETTPYEQSSTFDDNGDFQTPVPYGMLAYNSVKQNTSPKPPAGAIISVYA